MAIEPQPEQRVSLEDNMTKMPSLRGAALVAVLAAVPGLALAQSAGAPATAAAPAAHAPASPSTRAAAARVEAHIKRLHAALRITPAQKTQWDAFADVMRDNAHAIDEAAERRAERLPTMNAVEDLKSYEELAEQHVERLRKLIPAFSALYDTMPPHQKELADRVFRGRAARRHGR
jgi:periplasmic protein CpxP/Spy